MPLYRIMSERGAITSAQRAELAESIVEMHLRLAGGARWLVNVVFEEAANGGVFVGGKPAKRIFIGTSIRTGRSEQVKAALLTEYSTLVSRVLGVLTSDMIAGLDEINPDNVMEAGFILPKVGEEEAWLKKVTAATVA